jgi:predicted DNA-binding protein (MmcQ/YjbR family)
VDIEKIREYCLSKAGVTEDFPFDEHTLVFRVHQKIFLLTSLDREPPQLNLKCEPERALELREAHFAIIPGYHMNKRHWNTVILDGTLTDTLVLELVDDSYDLVFGSLPKKVQQALLG